MPRLLINGKTADVEAEADTPLLWVLRADLKLTGTKYGCGVGICGACTIHLIDRAAPALAAAPVQTHRRLELPCPDC